MTTGPDLKTVSRRLASLPVTGWLLVLCLSFPLSACQSTIFQWFDLEEFEAYRQLGYLMGWAYLANVGFTDAELTPFAACRSF